MEGNLWVDQKSVLKTNKEQLAEEKKQRKEDYQQRIPIEGKFGQGKNGYGLNLIKAKTRKTSESWIAAIFFVMNLLVLEKIGNLLAKNRLDVSVFFTFILIYHVFMGHVRYFEHRMSRSGIYG